MTEEQTLKKILEDHYERLEGLSVKMHQRGKSETSGLAGDLKYDIKSIKADSLEIKEHLADLNSKTAKHANALRDQAVMNAETLASIRAITKALEPVEKNTEFRLTSKGALLLITFIGSAGVVTGIITIVKIWWG